MDRDQLALTADPGHPPASHDPYMPSAEDALRRDDLQGMAAASSQGSESVPSEAATVPIAIFNGVAQG